MKKTNFGGLGNNIKRTLSRNEMKSVLGAGYCSVGCGGGGFVGTDCAGTCSSNQANGSVSCTVAGFTQVYFCKVIKEV